MEKMETHDEQGTFITDSADIATISYNTPRSIRRLKTGYHAHCYQHNSGGPETYSKSDDDIVNGH